MEPSAEALKILVPQRQDFEMSYDLRIYFPQIQFPDAEWAEILRLFGAAEQNNEGKLDHRYWSINTQTVVWIALYPVNLHADVSCSFGPFGTHWCVTLTTNSGGRTARSVWTQFAIPYYALSLISGTTVDDCDGTIYEDTAAFLEFAAGIMPGLPAVKCNYVKQNLMTPEGIPIF